MVLFLSVSLSLSISFSLAFLSFHWEQLLCKFSSGQGTSEIIPHSTASKANSQISFLPKNEKRAGLRNCSAFDWAFLTAWIQLCLWQIRLHEFFTLGRCHNSSCNALNHLQKYVKLQLLLATKSLEDSWTSVWIQVKTQAQSCAQNVWKGLGGLMPLVLVTEMNPYDQY